MHTSYSNLRLITLLERHEQQDCTNPMLKELYNRHSVEWATELVPDLCKDASNTIGWIFTGEVDYAECVRRAATKVGVPENDLLEDECKNEQLLLQCALKKYFEKLDPEERAKSHSKVMEEIGKDHEEILGALLKGSGASWLAIMQTVSPTIVRDIILKYMALAATEQTALVTARIATLAIPFINVVMAGWMIYDISGPAYRKIIPSVMNIALLRLS